MIRVIRFLGSLACQRFHPDHPDIQPKVGDPTEVVETVTPSVALPSRESVVIKILSCETWVAVMEVLDATAAVIKKDRAATFDNLLTSVFPKEKNKLLTSLLAEHLRQTPRDEASYNWLPTHYRQLKERAIALAKQK